MHPIELRFAVDKVEALFVVKDLHVDFPPVTNNVVKKPRGGPFTVSKPPGLSACLET